jgi:hypothetical protein
LEYSGLGRYGDHLNPEGDVEASEECFCVLKPGGYFLFRYDIQKALICGGMPTGTMGPNV